MSKLYCRFDYKWVWICENRLVDFNFVRIKGQREFGTPLGCHSDTSRKHDLFLAKDIKKKKVYVDDKSQ